MTLAPSQGMLKLLGDEIAIVITERMSSVTASVATKTRKGAGIRLPSTARMPRVKAMSVAVGTAQPRAVGPRLHAR